MMAYRPSIDLRLSPSACIFAALALLILPLRWIFAAALAAAVHEACHYLVLRLCGVQIYSFSFGMDGARIETEPMEERQELICALAGPVGSLMLLLLIRRMPILALCGGIQGIYNLLPILPFDGGRVVGSILGMICPRKRETIMLWVRRGTVTVIAALGIFASVGLKLGFGVLILAFLLIHKAVGRKIPCKDDRKRVQ